MINIFFANVKIPATNRFSKCEHCERLKKMLHTGNIEEGHDLNKEEFEKLQHEKVSMKPCRMKPIGR
jgi:glutaredoxin